MPVILDLIMTQVVQQTCPEHFFAVRLQTMTFEAKACNPFSDRSVSTRAGHFRAVKAVEFSGNDLLDGSPVGFFKTPQRQGFASLLRVPAQQTQTLLSSSSQSLIDFRLSTLRRSKRSRLGEL